MASTTTQFANETAYVQSAASKIRKAISALHHAGLNSGGPNASKIIADLERIVGVLTAVVTAARKPAEQPPVRNNPVPKPSAETLKGVPAPVVVKPAVPAPVVPVAERGFHTAGPITVGGRVVSTAATPEAVAMTAKVAAQTAAPVVKPTAPKAAAKPATQAPAAKTVPAPVAKPAKVKGEYRKLQARAKQLKIAANGTTIQLAARIAAAEAKPVTPPAPKVAAKAASPKAKPEPLSILYIAVGSGKFHPASEQEILAVLDRMTAKK